LIRRILFVLSMDLLCNWTNLKLLVGVLSPFPKLAAPAVGGRNRGHLPSFYPLFRASSFFFSVNFGVILFEFALFPGNRIPMSVSRKLSSRNACRSPCRAAAIRAFGLGLFCSAPLAPSFLVSGLFVPLASAKSPPLDGGHGRPRGLFPPFRTVPPGPFLGCGPV